MFQIEKPVILHERTITSFTRTEVSALQIKMVNVLENPRTSILWASVDSLAGRTLMDVTGTLFRLSRIVVNMSRLFLFKARRNVDSTHLFSDSAEGHSQMVK